MTTLRYMARGNGSRPLFCLHGFLGCGRNLASLARRLTEVVPDLTVILPDLNGHGESPPQPAEAGLEALAHSLEALRERLFAAQPVQVVGHSLGGRVALSWLREAPASVTQACFLDISPSPMRPEAGALKQVLDALLAAPTQVAERATMRAYFLQAGITAALTDWIMMNLVRGDAGFVWRCDRVWLRDLQRRALGGDLWPIVAAHADRLVSIVGGDSSYVSAGDQARLHSLGVAHHVLAGAGHFVHVDRHQQLVTLLARALS